MPIKVLIVDDHAVVRLGLRTLLADELDIEVVAEAADAEAAIEQTKKFCPDVVVLDIQMPGMNGIEVCKNLTGLCEKLKIVMLTSHTDEEFIEQAIQAGAAGYVLKQVGNEELTRAIKAVYAGEMAFDTKTTAFLVNRYRKMEVELAENALSSLSQRELEVVKLVAEGQSNKEIGKSLNLSEITVRNYVSKILSKLQLRNRIEIALFAVKNQERKNG
jgi:DNA-binding NarL/FixJ family response regulator